MWLSFDGTCHERECWFVQKESHRDADAKPTHIESSDSLSGADDAKAEGRQRHANASDGSGMA